MSIVSIVSIFVVLSSLFAFPLAGFWRSPSPSMAIFHILPCLSVSIVSIFGDFRAYRVYLSEIWMQKSDFCLFLAVSIVSIVSIRVYRVYLCRFSCLSCLSRARVYFSVSIVSIFDSFWWLSCLSVSIVSIFRNRVYVFRVYPIFPCNRAETYCKKN